jgi:hypothetical protein
MITRAIGGTQLGLLPHDGRTRAAYGHLDVDDIREGVYLLKLSWPYRPGCGSSGMFEFRASSARSASSSATSSSKLSESWTFGSVG